MKKLQWKSPAGIAIIAAAVLIVAAAAVLAVILLQTPAQQIVKVPAGEDYVYVNPDETKADPDAGMKIDGVLDEEIYQNKQWLHLFNDDGGNHVEIDMTSHFGEKGMYFVFDVTESVPIYVNLDRAPTLNSCVELYLAPSHVRGVQENTVFEIDLMPTGDLTFKKSNGKYGYENVATTNDIMACLGATTKGGEVNTAECYGYALELFIPWEYMQWLGQDVDAMKNGYVLVNPAHITSNNLTGTDHNLDRYWYHYAQKLGAGFTDVSQYFRFNGNGVMGTTEITLVEGEHYRFEGDYVAVPGMQVQLKVIPDEGYALTSLLVDGQEQLHKLAYNEDGSVTVLVRVTGGQQSISAKAEAVTEGKKTLSGKVRLNGAGSNALKDVLVSYIGPQGEKPVMIDAEGNFELKDLEQGYYELKVEKQGYSTLVRGICLNRDIYTELTLKTSVFQVTGGSCWILDDESEGILYKLTGGGDILSNAVYKNFTFETYIKYDKELAKLDKSDYYLQQRTGIRIMFSNGKYWHIDLMLENGQYVIQYGKITGDNSIYNWQNVHTMTKEQIAKYTSAEGIKVTVKRVGNEAVIFLDGKPVLAAELPKEYKSLSAQVGMESWVANSTIMKIPYSITGSAKLPNVPKPYFYAANTWDVTDQQKGIVYKTGVAGVTTWLEAAIDGNDITTTAVDLSPETNDYSMVYIFRFSNGEQFRVRLNHTDNDGKYRIQSFSGSTLFAEWKNRYTFTEAQTQKVQGEGIDFRVVISGTAAYVFLDGEPACMYDLSTVVATGKPSGIEKATVKVALRIDGNIGKVTKVPFKLVQNNDPIGSEKPEDTEDTVPYDPAKKITITIPTLANGTVKPVKTQYSLGQTVKLEVTPNSGYAQMLTINGEPMLLDWKTNTYSFVATEDTYTVGGSFVKSLSTTASDADRWDTANHAHGIVSTQYPFDNDSWWLAFNGDYKSLTVKAKNYLPIEQTVDNFMVNLRVTMDNGRTYNFRVYTDPNGSYAYNRAGIQNAGDAGADWSNWRNLAALNDVISGEGADFKVERTDGNVLTLSINGQVLDTYTMAGVTAANKVASIAVKHQGNQGKEIDIPYVLTEPGEEPPVVVPPVEEGDVQLNIADFANGTVTADKGAYNLGDTVTLTVAPNAGYKQMLFVNGEPMILGWKGNSYSFVAAEETYDITGSFVSELEMYVGDWSRWDNINQSHGVLSTYYPGNNDSGWMKFKGEYASISMNAKNYWTVENSYEGISNGGGWRTMLYMQLDNGNYYAFSMWINTSKQYAYNHYGAAIDGVTPATGWGGAWCLVGEKNAEAMAALNGDGAEFKLERIDGNHIQITLNGTVLETYEIPGVTEANKVVSVGMQHYGNRGEYVDIPFKLTKPGEEPPAQEGGVRVNIADFTNGTVTADKESYDLGDTVTLTVTPNADYVQKLYINGEPMILGWKGNTYSFTATEEVYEITGAFQESLSTTPSDEGRWDWRNQAHGLLSTYYPSNNDSWWMAFNGDYKSLTVEVKNRLPIEQTVGNFMVYLRVTMDNGRAFNFRVYTDPNGSYAYNRAGIQNAGDASADWGNWKNLSALNDLISGEGADFKVERTGGNVLTLSVNGEVLDTYTMAGVTAANKVANIAIKHQGNAGEMIQLPFVLTKAGEEPPVQGNNVQLSIADIANGTVTADKESYNVGDTVTLTVAANAGYKQKLYINGEPLILGWKTNTYSFTATEETYEITGSFVRELEMYAGDWGRWDNNNQAHGLLRTYYPNNNDSWWNKIKGEYTSISVNARNYRTVANSYEGISNGGGWRVMLYMQLDNNKYYAFSMWIDTSSRYAYNHYGGNIEGIASATGWGGAWCLLSEKNPDAMAALSGEGAEFKLERIDGNHIQITFGGTVLETYEIPGVTAANKVIAVGMQYNGNNGEYVDIPFEVK